MHIHTWVLRPDQEVEEYEFVDCIHDHKNNIGWTDNHPAILAFQFNQEIYEVTLCRKDGWNVRYQRLGKKEWSFDCERNSK